MFCVVLVPSPLGLWGVGIWRFLNVRKGTKKNFSVQTGSQLGVSRERIGIN